MKMRGKSVYESSDSVAMRDNLYELLLPVNFDHIEDAKGRRDNWKWDYRAHRHCPIALALKARIPSATDIIVALRATFKIGEQKFDYDLPSDAQEFIETFDDGGNVKPELFRLQLRRNV